MSASRPTQRDVRVAGPSPEHSAVQTGHSVEREPPARFHAHSEAAHIVPTYMQDVTSATCASPSLVSHESEVRGESRTSHQQDDPPTRVHQAMTTARRRQPSRPSGCSDELRTMAQRRVGGGDSARPCDFAPERRWNWNSMKWQACEMVRSRPS